MKILPILLLAASLPVCATGWSQNVSLRVEQAHPREVIKQLEKQTGYRFIYGSHLMEGSKPITIQADNQPLEKVLQQCFKEQPFGFEIDPPFVVLTKKPEASRKEVQAMVNKLDIDIRGRVIDGEGQPIAGATVQVKGSSNATSTDDQGFFTIKDIEPNTVLIITGAEIEDIEVSVGDKTFLNIQVTRKENTLDETLVIAYGKTSRRLNTGSVSKVTAAEISRQPVSNPILAIAGRVPGLMITPANGLPGANTSILLRGEQSLRNGTSPLILVDGIPLTTNFSRMADVNITGTQNILNSINPSDIESIEILKDAEATAIYGSQGANGVILITTKRGRSGQTSVTLNSWVGLKTVTRTQELLNTNEYLLMRKEAFLNDQITPTISNAPDLTEWEESRYTDWKKELIGGTGKVQNIQLSLSGGSEFTRVLASGSWYSETSVFPNDQPARRGTGRISFDHQSPKNKLNIQAGASYSFDQRKSPLLDLSRFIFLPPNIPAMKDSAGGLFWIGGFDNPYAFEQQRYDGQTMLLITNALISYQITNRLRATIGGGFNQTMMREKGRIPISAQRPGLSTRGSSYISNGTLQSWILEPQLNWSKRSGDWNIDGFLGLSMQRRNQTRVSVSGFDYTNDEFLGNISAAGRIDVSDANSEYRYIAGFGRIKASWKNKYIASLNFRRDGSSRFGPSSQFANFISLGAGWIFSDEKWFKSAASLVSFGKLRGSYGITGNDQIGDYQFFDGWATDNSYSYGMSPGFLPNSLYNPNLRWERTRKLQFGIELGIWKDRVGITADYYRNRSDNQLIDYTLPATTGFSGIQRNLDALIQNSGWEFSLKADLIKRKRFTWNTLITWSVPRNKLLRFPNLANSSYATSYVIGEPLRVTQRYKLEAIDQNSGLYIFKDFNGDGIVRPQSDYAIAGTLGQRSFGGIENSIRLGDFQLQCFIQVVCQTGRNYIASLLAMPGAASNQPKSVLNRWQNPNSSAEFQKFSQGAFGPSVAFSNYLNSDAAISDASFIRFKNISLSYAPSILKGKQGFNNRGIRFFLLSQDIFTITRYKGFDPETQSVQALPPLKSWVLGFEIKL